MKKITIPALILAAVFTTGAAHAQDAKAKEILEAVVKGVQASESQALTINVVSKGEVPGPAGPRAVEQRISFDLATAKPNQFRRITTVDDRVVEARVSDGKTLTSYLSDLQMYDVLPAPATHAELIKTDPVASLSVIPAMVGSEAVDQLIAMGDAHAYVAETDKVHRINFTTEEGPAYFLIAASEPPVLNQIVMGEGTPIVTTYDFKWAGAPTPEAFAYTAPAEAKKVENIQAEIQKLQSGEGETPSAALVGKPAPAVKLNNLQGEVVDIASHRGKDVVVLDFWATWCGPCRKLMPTLEKVATDYKEKGVVVYAVNQEEAPEEVKKFVADMKVGLNVLLDADGAVSASYMAMSIPQTVVIDKAGNVSKVHVGLTPEYEAEMRQHLDGLLAPATP